MQKGDHILDWAPNGEDSILVTAESEMTGEVNTMTIPMSEGPFQESLLQWIMDDKHIQDAFPNLTPPQREFIKTGATPEEWEEIFGPNPHNQVDAEAPA